MINHGDINLLNIILRNGGMKKNINLILNLIGMVLLYYGLVNNLKLPSEASNGFLEEYFGSFIISMNLYHEIFRYICIFFFLFFCCFPPPLSSLFFTNSISLREDGTVSIVLKLTKPTLTAHTYHYKSLSTLSI